MDKVTVVLLNWNGLEYIEKCIESVFKQTYSNVELIIVDNGSTDNSLEIVSRKYPDLQIIRIENNIGFAQGMNTGIKASSGVFILLLNLDVYLKEDYISKAIGLFENDEYLGCVGGIEFKWTKDGFINEHLASSGPFFLKKRIQLYPDATLKDQSCYAFGVTGSYPVFRRTVIDDLINVSGYFFDPLFQTGWEDTDVRFRMFWRGWKTFFSPELIGWHVGSSSADSKSRLIDKSFQYQQRIFRNRMYVIGKFPCRLKSRLAFTLSISNLLIISYFLFRSPKSLLALNRANQEFRKNKLSVSNQQSLIEKSATVAVDEIFKFFKKF